MNSCSSQRTNSCISQTAAQTSRCKPVELIAECRGTAWLESAVLQCLGGVQPKWAWAQAKRDLWLAKAAESVAVNTTFTRGQARVAWELCHQSAWHWSAPLARSTQEQLHLGLAVPMSLQITYHYCYMTHSFQQSQTAQQYGTSMGTSSLADSNQGWQQQMLFALLPQVTCRQHIMIVHQTPALHCSQLYYSPKVAQCRTAACMLAIATTTTASRWQLLQPTCTVQGMWMLCRVALRAPGELFMRWIQTSTQARTKP